MRSADRVLDASARARSPRTTDEPPGPPDAFYPQPIDPKSLPTVPTIRHTNQGTKRPTTETHVRK
jgi:hypothetical protein